MFSRIPLIPVVIVLCAGLDTASAQTYRAQLSGTVSDQSAAAIPGVNVRARNIATGVGQTTKSNELGIYRFSNLQPGSYTVEAEQTGFKRFVRDGITLQVADDLTLDIAMELGEVSEAVTVSAAAPLLESANADFSQLINERRMQELPLNTRNALKLAVLTPGFSKGSSYDNGAVMLGSDFRVGGGRSLAQEILIDGTPSSSSDKQYREYVPPVDSTQEYKIMANAFSAEYGRTTGAVVNMVTKSGTNKFHGVAYEFFRDDALDANNFFANRAGQSKPGFRRSQFGANLGGPIIRNKTFFFVDYDALRQAIPSTLTATVPTALQRSGDFSETYAASRNLIKIFDPMSLTQAGSVYNRTPFPGNRVPISRIDPVAAKSVNFYPDPNQPGAAVTGVNNYLSTASNRDDQWSWSGKVDHNFSDWNRLSGRISQNRFDTVDPAIWPGPSAPASRSRRVVFTDAVISDLHTFTPTLFLDVRAAESRAHTDWYPISKGFDLAQLSFPSNLIQQTQPVFPTFQIDGMTNLGNQSLLFDVRDTYSFEASVGKFSGRHSFKAGVDARIYHYNHYNDANPAGLFTFNRTFTRGPNPFTASAEAGYGLASFLLGAGNTGSRAHVMSGAFGRRYYASYFQDDWKINSRLTLNWGLRYSLETGPTERFDRYANIDFGAPSPLGNVPGLGPLRGTLVYLDPNNRNLMNTDTNNFDPRAGLAYQASGSTVIRAGYGIFHVPMQIDASLGSFGFESSTPWITTRDGSLTVENRLSNPFPEGFNLPKNERDPAFNIGYGLSGTIRDERVGYTQQWSLAVQRQLPKSFVLDLTYWGNKGTGLQWGTGFEENWLPDQYLALGSSLYDMVPNPFFGIISSGTLSQKTVARRQLLLPYPQYTSLGRSLPMAASSIYHAFTISAERRMGSFNLSASYTVAKTIDDNSSQTASDNGGGILDMENRRLERSLSPLDVSQRLVFSAIYELPVGRKRAFGSQMNAILDGFIGGWTISGIASEQSGLPVTVGRPDNNGNSAKLADPSIDRWFNTAVFSPAQPFTFGTTGRTLPDVRTDGLKSLDLGLFKDFLAKERFRIQFRTELFNAFNTPNFGYPNGSVISPSFGMVSSQANEPRKVQFGLKFYW